MTGLPPISISRRGSIAILTLCRPDNGNAIDIATAEALRDAARNIADDASCRCALLRATGRFFCVGGDLASFVASPQPMAAVIDRITGPLHEAISRFARMDKPLVTAVQGAAAGAGLGLALLGDIVIAGKSSTYTPAYSAVGLAPDGGVSWLLPRLMGLRAAQNMLLTNRKLSAEEALHAGLVSRVVEDGDVENESLGVAEALSTGPTGALGIARRLLLDCYDGALETHLEREARGIASAAEMPAGLEGVMAFRERRKPVFAC